MLAFHMYLVKHIISIIHCCSYSTPAFLTNHHRHQNIGTSLYQLLNLDDMKEKIITKYAVCSSAEGYISIDI